VSVEWSEIPHFCGLHAHAADLEWPHARIVERGSIKIPVDHGKRLKIICDRRQIKALKTVRARVEGANR
jgi:hypothetical protein